MTSIKDIYKKHLKSISANHFIYAVKVAWHILTERERSLYELGFVDGYMASQEKMKLTQDAEDIKKLASLRRTSDRQYGNPPRLNIDSLINKVCIRLEVNKAQLFTKSRMQDIVRARNLIHNILSEKYFMAASNIAKIFSQDHTTVLHSLNMKTMKERFWSPEQSIWQDFEELIK